MRARLYTVTERRPDHTELCGSVPGGQAEYLRVPMAHFGPVKVPNEHPDERSLYLSDIIPTAWQAVEYASIPKGGSVAVFGLGPVGQFCAYRALPRRRDGHRSRPRRT